MDFEKEMVEGIKQIKIMVDEGCKTPIVAERRGGYWRNVLLVCLGSS